MDAVNKIINDNGVRLYYVLTKPDPDMIHTSLVMHYLVAGIVIDEPSPDYFKHDIEQCVMMVGRTPALMYFKTHETPEDAYKRMETGPYDVYTRATLYSKEHAIEILSHLKAASAANNRWRSYYDQVDAILDRVLGLLK